MKRILFACLLVLTGLLPQATARDHRAAEEAQSAPLYGIHGGTLYQVSTTSGRLKKIADLDPAPDYFLQLSYDRNHHFLVSVRPSAWLPERVVASGRDGLTGWAARPRPGSRPGRSSC